MSYRSKGETALRTVLNSTKNIKIFEKYVHLKTLKEPSHKQEYIYKRYLYQIIGDISQNGANLKAILTTLKQGKLGWKHPSFSIMADKIAEQNDFIENPFEVEEGVFECKAFDSNTGKICGSKRVFSYSKQDRSCDEGTSVYCQCITCKAQWRERG